MDSNTERLNALTSKLENLSKGLDYYSSQIHELRREIALLKLEEEHRAQKQTVEASPKAAETIKETSRVPVQESPIFRIEPPTKSIAQEAFEKLKVPEIKSDFEKFVGGNLANKIGIVITVLGVAIGVKYAIDHELISPLTRIILGYLTGIGLLLFSIKLKKNYESFSAVLLSGAMAIMYFITYAAYSYYNLIPVGLAFGLMAFFTVFTVFAALQYNMQLIAIYGLVGAYAVPYLLSDGSGKVHIMFSYMAIINAGILIIAFKKYWKALFYSAFGLTWLIYISWYLSSYDSSRYFATALIFLTVFFALFYATFLAYKLLRNEAYGNAIIITIMLNSLIFFGFGYNIIDSTKNGNDFLGAFALLNAGLHLIVAYVVNMRRLSDKKLFYLILAIAMAFITIAIPIQLNGNWVTILWAIEAALLFWIGRSKGFAFYEKLSYILIALAFLSMADDWQTYYSGFNYEGTVFKPILNTCFLTAMLFCLSLAFIIFISQKNQLSKLSEKWPGLVKTMSYIIPALLIFSVYNTFTSEISAYWNNQLYNNVFRSGTRYTNFYNEEYNLDFNKCKIIWLINFTLVYLTALSALNLYKLKNKSLGIVNLLMNTFALFVFLSVGLYVISELRESYLNAYTNSHFQQGVKNIYIRYVSLACVPLIIYAIYRYIKAPFMGLNFAKPFELLIHTVILWVTSSELIHWLDLASVQNLYKSGLSILWGSYSLMLVVLGIWQKKKHLRLAGIGLFTVTLLKLFLYDIAALSTISKTIVMVSLGVLLLIISFLYNKYKDVLFEDDKA